MTTRGTVVVALTVLAVMACALCESEGALGQETPVKPNLVFIKVEKVGGTTVAGVLRQVALRAGLSGSCDDNWIRRDRQPGIWANHSPRTRLDQQIKALSHPSLFVSMIRDPAERCSSDFYYRSYFCYVCPEHKIHHRAPTLSDMRLFAGHHCRNHLSEYLRVKSPGEQSDFTLSRYHFIGTTERAEESFLALYELFLRPMYNASIYDILHVNAKNISSQDYDRRAKFQHIPLSQEPHNVQQFFRNDFRQMNSLDTQLYSVVNERLDKQIASIENWPTKLANYRHMLQYVQEKCAGVASPFTSRCLVRDEGCGQECLARVSQELGNTEPLLPVVEAHCPGKYPLPRPSHA